MGKCRASVHDGRMSRAVLIVLISALVMLGPFTNNIMVPALPSVATGLNITFSDAQLILSVFMAGFAAGQLFVGPMSDRFGRKPVLVDSFGTLDEDRWWDAAAYANGEIVQLSKEFVRGHYIETGHHSTLDAARRNGTDAPPIPALPQHVIDKTATLYIEMFERLTGQTFHDVSCGMRCYSRRAAMSLNPIGRFTYTQEVFLNLAFKQLRIVEVPLRVRGEREFGESRVASNLWSYGARTARIIFRSYRAYYPLRFFGGIALALMVPAVGLSGFLLWHYLEAGSLSPHKWAGFSALGLTGLAVLMLHMGVIGDMQKFTQYQAAEAIGDAAKNPGAGGMMAGGMGAGVGFAMANQLSGQMGQQGGQQGQGAGLVQGAEPDRHHQQQGGDAERHLQHRHDG